MALLGVVVGLLIVLAVQEIRDRIARKNRKLWPTLKPVFRKESWRGLG